MVAATTTQVIPNWITVMSASNDAVGDIVKAIKGKSARILVSGSATGDRNRLVPRACYTADVCQLTLKSGLTPSAFMAATRRHKQTFDVRPDLLILEDFENWESLTLKEVSLWASERNIPILITTDLDSEVFTDSKPLKKQLAKL